jgi:hypothetical protein
MSGPSKEQAAAREQVMKSEQEIQSIKAALRKLGTAENADAPNSVEICMLKVCCCFPWCSMECFVVECRLSNH